MSLIKETALPANLQAALGEAATPKCCLVLIEYTFNPEAGVVRGILQRWWSAEQRARFKAIRAEMPEVSRDMVRTKAEYEHAEATKKAKTNMEVRERLAALAQRKQLLHQELQQTAPAAEQPILFEIPAEEVGGLLNEAGDITRAAIYGWLKQQPDFEGAQDG